MPERKSRGRSNAERLTQMHVLATVLKNEYPAARNAQLDATRNIAPVSLQATPENDINRVCGPYNFVWRLGHGTVTAYVDTAFPEIKEMLMGGAKSVSELTAPEYTFKSKMEQKRARLRANLLGDTLLILQAKSSRPWLSCVAVETSERPDSMAIHGGNCESIEAQFMVSAFDGNPEALAEMEARMKAVAGADVPFTYNALDVLRGIYLPPQPL